MTQTKSGRPALKRGPRTDIKKQNRLLKELVKNPCLAAACRNANVTYHTGQRWMKDEKFKAKAEQAKSEFREYFLGDFIDKCYSDNRLMEKAIKLLMPHLENQQSLDLKIQNRTKANAKLNVIIEHVDEPEDIAPKVIEHKPIEEE